MAIEIDQARRDLLIGRLRGFFLEEFDEEISRFRAEQVLDFHLAALGPQVYNQGVQDARKFMQERLDGLGAGPSVVPGTNTRLTFGGDAALTLFPGGGAWSDPAPFDLVAFERLALSLDVASADDISTHTLGLAFPPLPALDGRVGGVPRGAGARAEQVIQTTRRPSKRSWTSTGS